MEYVSTRPCFVCKRSTAVVSVNLAPACLSSWHESLVSMVNSDKGRHRQDEPEQITERIQVSKLCRLDYSFFMSFVFVRIPKSIRSPYG